MKTINWQHDGVWHYGDVVHVVFEDEFDILLRYETDACKGIYTPLVKFNKESKKLYFLTQRSFSGDYPYPDFETKGCKAYLN
jgi:hypothetical protein